MAGLLLLSAFGALLGQASAFTSATVQEQEFVVGSQRLVLLGIDYQPGGQGAYGASNTQDPLSNGTTCLRDFTLMQTLGVNAIRSYNVDPTLNHDECMSILAEAGIYVVLDVNSPLAGQSIDRSNPADSYNVGYLTHVFGVVEAFKDYPNILGFFSGNEVINDVPTAKDNPQYIRAVQRDLNNYIAKRASRAIPVGYSAADVRPILQDTSTYMQCDNGDNSRSAFFAVNSYSWCGSATYTSAGYDQLVTIFQNSTIPTFFSEYGCNQIPAGTSRPFTEVQAIYGPNMTALSGGLVYEWSQETDDFGLVDLYSNGSAHLRGDYINLSNQYAKVDLNLISTTNSTATSLQPPKCNSNLISNSGFSKNFNIPAAPDGAAALISNGVSGISTGQIVSVTQTSVAATVYNTDWAQVTGLSLKSVSGPNHPGNNAFTAGTTAIGATTAAAATTASTSSKTGGMPHMAVATNGVALGAAVALAALAL